MVSPEPVAKSSPEEDDDWYNYAHYCDESRNNVGNFTVHPGANSGLGAHWNLITLSNDGTSDGKPLALVDTAAGQAVIGVPAYHSLCGFLSKLSPPVCPVLVRFVGPRPNCNGIGGSASVLGYTVVPICIGTFVGYVRFLLVEEAVPPLLPIGLLRSLNSIIDLTHGHLIVTPGGPGSETEVVPMVTLASGHQASRSTISLCCPRSLSSSPKCCPA